MGAVRDFLAGHGENLFHNLRRREDVFNAQLAFLGHSYKKLKIPRQCMKVSPLTNKELDLLDDNYALDEFGFEVKNLFGKGWSLRGKTLEIVKKVVIYSLYGGSDYVVVSELGVDV